MDTRDGPAAFHGIPFRSRHNPTECSGPPHLLGPWGSAGLEACASGLLITPLPTGHLFPQQGLPQTRPRHARTCCGHRRLKQHSATKTWMAGTSPEALSRINQPHSLSVVVPRESGVSSKRSKSLLRHCLFRPSAITGSSAFADDDDRESSVSCLNLAPMRLRGDERKMALTSA